MVDIKILSLGKKVQKEEMFTSLFSPSPPKLPAGILENLPGPSPDTSMFTGRYIPSCICV